MRSAVGKPAFLVGIDLGTTNTVVAYADANDAQAGIQLFAIEQLLASGEVGARPLLPSLRYHPAAGELAAGDLQLPWPQQDVEHPVLGALARQLGAQVPGRLVSSAKSWLSHANVDRQAPILPWGADADVAKVSPVAASASYLAYVRAAWNHRFPQAPLEEQELVLTIPASFDEGARALTLEAARLAGLPTLRLVEEPQAAFYDFLQRRRTTLRDDLANTRRILVCDVGGGTTDFSLIDVAFDEDGEPQLTRSSVGNHLILGGDNMDLALAHLVETRMAAGVEGGMKLSAARLSPLSACSTLASGGRRKYSPASRSTISPSCGGVPASKRDVARWKRTGRPRRSANRRSVRRISSPLALPRGRMHTARWSLPASPSTRK